MVNVDNRHPAQVQSDYKRKLFPAFLFFGSSCDFLFDWFDVRTCRRTVILSVRFINLFFVFSDSVRILSINVICVFYLKDNEMVASV